MADRTKNYTNKLAKMIKFDTVSNRENNDIAKFRRFHKVLESNFPNVFSKCVVEDLDGNLLIRWKGIKKDKPILFMNHQDVVPVSGDWKYPGFSAKVVDGKMYGRGTLDTKGGLFSMLQAADELILEGYKPKQDIYFVSGCNEETSGLGAKHISEIFQKRKIKFDYLIDEGGYILEEPIAGVKATYAMIGLGERGSGNLRFEAKSNGGHASTPPKNTPLVRLGKMMAYIEDHNIFEVEINDVILEMLRRFSYDMDGGIKYAYRYASKIKPIMKKIMPTSSPMAKAMVQTTIAFTKCEGSSAINVLPSMAYVIGDMRVSHHEGYQKSLEKVKEVAKMFDVDVIEMSGGSESNLATYKSHGFMLAEEAIGQIFENVKVAPYIMNQCSDAKSMSPVCDTCLRFVPFIITQEQVSTIHGINENVDICNLEKAVDFYKYMMSH